jgi:hypothetical protein
MNFYRILFLSLSIFTLCGFTSPFVWLFGASNHEPYGTTEWLNKEMQILHSQASNIDTEVLRLSLIAYLNAERRGYHDRKKLLTVIDFSKPSNERRFWVFDLARGRALYNTFVSHGKNSGGINATSFSNSMGSLKSSLGLYLTEEPYVGSVGYALRLQGLEPGINDNAYRRDIVVHGAPYVNAATIRRYGQVGRSWGCPAVSSELARPIINTIKEHTLVFAYYPDRSWLSHSQFLAG